ATFRPQVDEVREDRAGVNGRAVGGQPHELVFTAVDLEPAVVGEGGVEESQGVREVKVLLQFELVASPDAPGRSRPLADSVEGEDGRLVERAREERARRMALMVIHKQQRRARFLWKAAAD